MAGYWPSSFFAYLWTETESRSKNLQNVITAFWGTSVVILATISRGNHASELALVVVSH